MIRTTRPTKGNKYFNTKSNGGFSTCIKGKPTDSQCDVLSNCVGYANGAFNEELNLGYEKYHFNCNAEDFIKKAKNYGLEISQTPVVGGIMVWEGKGNKAGHVAIVIDIIDNNTIKTAESGYGSKTPFWTTTRKNNNKRWGMNENYPFLGCIINPNYPVPQPTPTPTPEPEPTPEPTPIPILKYKIGDKVIIDGQLYGDADGNFPGQIVKDVITTITRTAEGHLYPYNTTGDLGWMAEPCIKLYTKPEPQPEPDKLKVGDKVKIIKTGKASSFGDNPTAGGIGWTREILKIYKDRPYPYQIGNKTGTTGFYKEDAIKKL